ncbi:MAG: hypothetical protein K2X82_07050 [Gemmataceae bacterium]|nr:hypothetical protein [Gemmataceae bacterium]
MARPRKAAAGTGPADPMTLVADVLDEVKTVLRDKGISIPLSTWIEAQQAALALIPTAPAPAPAAAPDLLTNHHSS